MEQEKGVSDLDFYTTNCYFFQILETLTINKTKTFSNFIVEKTFQFGCVHSMKKYCIYYETWSMTAITREFPIIESAKMITKEMQMR